METPAGQWTGDLCITTLQNEMLKPASSPQLYCRGIRIVNKFSLYIKENKVVLGHFLVRAMHYGLHLPQPYLSTLYPFLSSEPDFSLYKNASVLHCQLIQASQRWIFSATCLCRLPHKTKEILLQMSQCTFRNGLLYKQ